MKNEHWFGLRVDKRVTQAIGLTALVLVSQLTSVYPTYAEPLIQNGRDAVAGEFPEYVEMVDVSLRHRCGGTLLDGDSILIAAHCVAAPFLSFSLNSYSFLAGSVKVGDPEASRKWIAFCKFFPGYDPGFNLDEITPDDVAVCTTVGSFQFSETVKPVVLAKPEDVVTGVTVIGQGRVATDTVATVLQVGETQFNGSTCPPAITNCAPPLPRNILVGDGRNPNEPVNPPTHIRKGDSGSPMFWTVNGIRKQFSLVSGADGEIAFAEGPDLRDPLKYLWIYEQANNSKSFLPLVAK